MKRSMSNVLTGLREGWGLAKPFFWSEERWSAIGLLAAIIVLTLFTTGLNVVFTYWQKYFYDSLQNKDFGAFIKLLFVYERVPVFPYFIIGYAEYLVAFVTAAVYAFYLQQMLQIKWRQWLTRDFTSKWLADRAYYNITVGEGDPVAASPRLIDNPDQRISQDLNDFTNYILNYGLSLFTNVVTLCSFVTVLYAISGSIKIFGIVIPGYMLWLAIIYSLIGTLITHAIGKRLIGLTFNQQLLEANFRYSLIRIRDNSEAIALSRGESGELESLRAQFAFIRENWWAIMKRTKLVGFFTNSFNLLAVPFPLAAAAPRYFAGVIQLGDLIQISSVFGNVVSPLSWIISNYTDLVVLRATISRLHGFKEAVAAARAASLAGPQVAAEGEALRFENLTLSLPDGRNLIDKQSLTLLPGEPVLLTGASGAGKSTLFRAIAGIWPFGEGRVSRPSGTALFLPQKPYFPLGTLKRAVAYPALESAVSDTDVREALIAVELPLLAERLEEVQNWGQVLSGGEQQRLALARALVAKPDWLFLDEATSAMDAGMAARLNATLAKALPGTTVVAISHHAVASGTARHVVVGAEGLKEA